MIGVLFATKTVVQKDGGLAEQVTTWRLIAAAVQALEHSGSGTGYETVGCCKI